MREVLLRTKEQDKYSVIKELVDHGGNKKRAALRLSLSVRQVNRLIIVYRKKGKAGFVHGNRNRQPANSLPQELDKKIVALYRDEYQGFNFKHFTEKINESEGIDASYKTVCRILNNNGYFTFKEHRATKRRRAIENIKTNKPDIQDKDLCMAVNHEISIADAHPRKPCAKYFGEEIQMDGSIHRWFSDTKATLHLAIDNASGIIVGAYFTKEETLNGYYHVFKQILTTYGIPAKFLTDNRSVFNYQTAKHKREEKDILTQFGYACKQLGTDIETSSVSQHKGQVERANGTLQDRLVSELRKEGITDMKTANEYLINVFVPDFNKRFSLEHTQFESVMEASLSEDVINRTLAICAPRKFDNGSAISYKNKTYQATDEHGKLVTFKPKTKCLVIESFDKNLYVTVDDQVYLLQHFERNMMTSPSFDIEVKALKERKKWIPPMSHPWKHQSFLRQQQHSHNQKIYTG